MGRCARSYPFHANGTLGGLAERWAKWNGAVLSESGKRRWQPRLGGGLMGGERLTRADGAYLCHPLPLFGSSAARLRLAIQEMQYRE